MEWLTIVQAPIDYDCIAGEMRVLAVVATTEQDARERAVLHWWQAGNAVHSTDTVTAVPMHKVREGHTVRA